MSADDSARSRASDADEPTSGSSSLHDVFAAHLGWNGVEFGDHEDNEAQQNAEPDSEPAIDRSRGQTTEVTRKEDPGLLQMLDDRRALGGAWLDVSYG